MLALLDIAEDIDGQTLAIPKKHMESILDYDSETLNAVMNTAQFPDISLRIVIMMELTY